MPLRPCRRCKLPMVQEHKVLSQVVGPVQLATHIVTHRCMVCDYRESTTLTSYNHLRQREVM